MRILIASLPRTGSTMLFRAIAGLHSKKTTPTNPYCEFVRDLHSIPKKPFLKTHSPAPENLPSDIRVIYLYGDPIKAVVSTKNKRWDRNSLYKNNWFHEEEPDIFNKDDLGFENNFDSWLSVHNYPVLAIRYESIWTYHHILTSYLGFHFKLPKPQKRSTEVNEVLNEHLHQVYHSLIHKIEQTPNATYIKESIKFNPRLSDFQHTPKLESLSMQKKRLYNMLYEKYIRRLINRCQ